jgi:hypothetical protein
VGWLAAGLVLGFAAPFLLADTLELDRDLYYGLYGALAVSFVYAWSRATGLSLREAARRRIPLTLGLTALVAPVLVVVVYRTEDATPRPDGLELAAALAWRGVVYGAVDGLLLSAFPILAVLAAFAGTRMRDGLGGRIAVGALALAASLLMTTVYHLGYSDFRSEKVRRPVAGDVLWSTPTLLTLNPLGATAAHVTLHVAAVTHSYETELFLPPHE